MVSVAGCHLALVPPDGHCHVTEPRHNAASSSSDTNWFLPTPSFPAAQWRKVVVTAWLSTGSCSFCKTSGGLLCAGIGLDIHVTAGKCPEARFRWSWFQSVALVRNEVKIFLICYYFVNNFSNSPAASASLEGSCQLQ